MQLTNPKYHIPLDEIELANGWGDSIYLQSILAIQQDVIRSVFSQKHAAWIQRDFEGDPEAANCFYEILENQMPLIGCINDSSAVSRQLNLILICSGTLNKGAGGYMTEACSRLC